MGHHPCHGMEDSGGSRGGRAQSQSSITAERAQYEHTSTFHEHRERNITAASPSSAVQQTPIICWISTTATSSARTWDIDTAALGHTAEVRCTARLAVEAVLFGIRGSNTAPLQRRWYTCVVVRHACCSMLLPCKRPEFRVVLAGCWSRAVGAGAAHCRPVLPAANPRPTPNDVEQPHSQQTA